MKLTRRNFARLTSSTLATIFMSTASAAENTAEPIRVLVWDEQQPEQKQGYGEKFLGETLAAHLAKLPGLAVKTAKLDEADQGLSDAELDATDVLIFWSHRRAKEQDDARAEAEEWVLRGMIEHAQISRSRMRSA